MNTSQQFIALKQQAFNFFNSGNLEQARIQCHNYCSSFPKDPEAWCLLSVIYGSQNLYTQSEQYARQAISISPDYIQAHFNLGVALLNLEQYEKAVIEFDHILGKNNKHGMAYYLKGKCLTQQAGQMHKAQTCFENALNIMTSPPRDLLLDLAQLYEHQGNNEKSINIIKNILNKNPLDPQAGVLMAAHERRENKLEEAESRLKSLLKSGLESFPDIARIENSLGHVLDRLQKYDEAYTAFKNSQDAIKRTLTENINTEFWYDRIKDNRRFITLENVKHWQNHYTDNNPSPIFLIGFPRSGTTLTEKIISSHPGANTSDEYPLIQDLMKKMYSFTNINKKYPESLNELTAGNIKVLRKEYWKIAKNKCNYKSNNSIFIDKLPLNTIELGFIYKIFPEAKILLLIRDPRDVCLSCFMQLFKPNDAMNNFLDLESTSRFYNETMNLLSHYRTVLNINIYSFHYENIIADLEYESRALFDYLEIKWNKDILKFYKKKSKTISTPSYQDIQKPLYSRAANRWKNYQQYLKPILKTLNPHIKELGYEI